MGHSDREMVTKSLRASFRWKWMTNKSLFEIHFKSSESIKRSVAIVYVALPNTYILYLVPIKMYWLILISNDRTWIERKYSLRTGTPEALISFRMIESHSVHFTLFNGHWPYDWSQIARVKFQKKNIISFWLLMNQSLPIVSISIIGWPNTVRNSEKNVSHKLAPRSEVFCAQNMRVSFK